MDPFVHGAGRAAIGAGVLTLVTVAYFAVVMPALGFELVMFDDRAALLSWLGEGRHLGVYRVLFVLAFAVQLLLLPAPWALHRHLQASGRAERASGLLAVVATGAVAASLTGPLFAFGSAGLVLEAFATGQRDQAVLLGDLFADLTKDIRLFLNVVVGAWLALAGVDVVRRLRRRVAGGGIAVLGGLLTMVSAYKIVNPLTAAEDILSPFLGLGYLTLGVVLLRSSGPVSPPPAGSAATSAPPARR